MDYKLTQKSQEAISAAVRRAATEGHPHVEPAHQLVQNPRDQPGLERQGQQRGQVQVHIACGVAQHQVGAGQRQATNAPGMAKTRPRTAE